MKFFREILTIVAGLVVLALTAALAAPYFIDWGSHRARIEAHLGEALGVPVRIRGAIDLRILPAPRLAMANVAAGAEGGAFAAEAARILVELAPMALLRGQLHFTEARIENPDITITPQQGRSSPRSAEPAGAAVAFDALTIIGGRVRVARSGAAPVVISDVVLEASAQSLTGPWRGAGEARHGGRALPFYFNTAAQDGDRVRVKFAVEPAAPAPRLEFDGALALSDSLATSALEGVAKIAGRLEARAETAAPFEVTGPLRLDLQRALMDGFELRGGVDERSFSASGRAELDFLTGAIEVAMETPRIDLDYLLGARERAGGALGDVVGYAQGLISGAATAPILRARLKAPAVIVGGEALGDVALSLSGKGDPHFAIFASAGLPGRGSIALEGDVETGPAARFKGRGSFETQDLERFAQWLTPAFAEASKMASLPFSRLSLSGDFEASAAAFFSRNASLQADRSRFTGLISAARAVGPEPARVALDLKSPALDLDAIPDLTPMLRATDDLDFSLALEARAVRLARVGQGVVDAGRILARARRSGQKIEVEQFDISGLGGASFAAKGESNETGARLSVQLDAQRLTDFAALMQRIAPGVWSDALAKRSVALSPAALTLSAESERRNGAFQLRALNLKGLARGTQISGSFTPAAEQADAGAGKLVLVNPQTPMLLRQLGVETIPLERLPEGRIEIDAAGSFGAGFEGRARAQLAGTAIEWQGQASVAAPLAEWRGRVAVASRDASPLLQILALALPDASLRAPLDFSGALAGSNGRWSLDGLKGEALGSRFTGALAFAPEAAAGAGRVVSGQLNIDRLSVEAISALVLGPRPPVRPNMIWPDFRFAAAVAEPLPSRLWINADRLALPGGVDGEAARFNLQLGPGLAAVTDLHFRLSGGVVSGRGELRRDRSAASVSGDLNFEGRLPASGDFSASARARLEFAGSGVSYAALASSLAGKGRIEFPELKIAGADRGALARTLGETLEMLDITEGKVSGILSRELAKAPAALDGAGFDLALAGGQITVASEEPPVSLAFDLRRMTMDAALRLAAPAPDGWRAAAPQAVLRWQGPANAPRRSLNVAALLNGLGARAIEREAARIELLEFDARERAAFNRRARAEEFLRQREVEIAAFHAEQERRALEDKRREEEARQKQIEDQRAAARRAEAERERRERATPPSRPPGAPLQLTPAPGPAPAPGSLNDPAALGRY